MTKKKNKFHLWAWSVEVLHQKTKTATSCGCKSWEKWWGTSFNTEVLAYEMRTFRGGDDCKKLSNQSLRLKSGCWITKQPWNGHSFHVSPVKQTGAPAPAGSYRNCAYRHSLITKHWRTKFFDKKKYKQSTACITLSYKFQTGSTPVFPLNMYLNVHTNTPRKQGDSRASTSPWLRNSSLQCELKGSKCSLDDVEWHRVPSASVCGSHGINSASKSKNGVSPFYVVRQMSLPLNMAGGKGWHVVHHPWQLQWASYPFPSPKCAQKHMIILQTANMRPFP